MILGKLVSLRRSRLVVRIRPSSTVASTLVLRPLPSGTLEDRTLSRIVNPRIMKPVIWRIELLDTGPFQLHALVYPILEGIIGKTRTSFPNEPPTESRLGFLVFGEISFEALQGFWICHTLHCLIWPSPGFHLTILKWTFLFRQPLSNHGSSCLIVAGPAELDGIVGVVQ